MISWRSFAFERIGLDQSGVRAVLPPGQRGKDAAMFNGGRQGEMREGDVGRD